MNHLLFALCALVGLLTVVLTSILVELKRAGRPIKIKGTLEDFDGELSPGQVVFASDPCGALYEIAQTALRLMREYDESENTPKYQAEFYQLAYLCRKHDGRKWGS